MKSSQLSSMAVEARGLVKIFGDHHAVDGVDLHIPAGGIYGVLGPNGAGKTTVIRMLATLLRPDGGSAKVFGYDVVKDNHMVRQLIGLTGQYASVDEKLSATENLIIFSRLLGLNNGEAKRRANELLAAFGLTEAAKRPLAQYSGGMRRRLDLAASLIAQPALLFLDEPTTGLDPHTRNQMWNTIRQLVNKGSTVVLTTQYLDEADQLADRIAVIDRGKVIAEGTPDQLKAKVGKAALELKLADGENLPQAKKIIQQLLLAEVHVAANNTITAPMLDAEMITDLLLALRNARIGLLAVSVKSPSLDEVFLTLTGQQTQTILTGSVATGVNLRDDMDKGVFDRFRSLPVARIAPLAGALIADAIRYVIVTVLTFAMGYIMGLRPQAGIIGVLEASCLVIFFAWCTSWIFAFLGVIAKTASGVQGISMMILFPLTFLSNAFVPVNTLPKPLKWFAEVNPVSHLVNAIRTLLQEGKTGNDFWLSLIGALVIMVVFSFVTVKAYTRKAA